jgi:hypothetical protein
MTRITEKLSSWAPEKKKVNQRLPVSENCKSLK